MTQTLAQRETEIRKELAEIEESIEQLQDFIQDKENLEDERIGARSDLNDATNRQMELQDELDTINGVGMEEADDYSEGDDRRDEMRERRYEKAERDDRSREGI